MLDVLVPLSQETAGSSSTLSSVTFRLIPVPTAFQFPAAKLAPGRNNVRSHTSAGTEGVQQPTPSYNAAVLQVDPLFSRALGLLVTRLACGGATQV